MTDINEGASPKNKESAPEEEKTQKEKEQDGVKVRFCVFFDGTNNNRANTLAREKNSKAYQDHKPEEGEDPNSYEGDRTNVEKMETYIDTEKKGKYDYLISIYVEGPGTENEKEDRAIGYGLGKGGTGVKKKVDDGINWVLEGLSDNLGEDDIIDELVLDVFGFSRGAAGARYFIHRALKRNGGLLSPVYRSLEKEGGHLSPLQSGLTNRGLLLSAEPLARRIRAGGFEIRNEDVRIDFVGLFDTVSSEGFRHNDINSLKLTSVGLPKVSTVVHLVAADEHRGNFSYTNINSAGERGMQIFLPGVHSDIGGGYRNDIEENLVLNESYDREKLESDRIKLVEQGWFKKDQVFIESPTAEFAAFHHREVPQRDLHRLKSLRTGLGNGYAKIPLNIMAECLRKTEIELKGSFERDEKIPSDLTKIYDDLLAYVKKKESKLTDWDDPEYYDWLMELRNKHLHFSAHCKLSYGVLKPHKPNFDNGQRKRKHYHG